MHEIIVISYMKINSFSWTSSIFHKKCCYCTSPPPLFFSLLQSECSNDQKWKVWYLYLSIMVLKNSIFFMFLFDWNQWLLPEKLFYSTVTLKKCCFCPFLPHIEKSKCVESDTWGLSLCVWLEFYGNNATFQHKYLKLGICSHYVSRLGQEAVTCYGNVWVERSQFVYSALIAVLAYHKDLSEVSTTHCW